MALIQKTQLNKIEIVGPFKLIQVRMATTVEDDQTGEQFGGEKFSRYVVAPGENTTGKPAEVQQLASTLHTPELITAYQASLADPDNPVDPPPTIPQRLSRLQAHIAINHASNSLIPELVDASGNSLVPTLESDVQAWRADPVRTPLEIAYYEHSEWAYTDPLINGFGLPQFVIDALFRYGATQ